MQFPRFVRRVCAMYKRWTMFLYGVMKCKLATIKITKVSFKTNLPALIGDVRVCNSSSRTSSWSSRSRLNREFRLLFVCTLYLIHKEVYSIIQFLTLNNNNKIWIYSGHLEQLFMRWYTGCRISVGWLELSDIIKVIKKRLLRKNVGTHFKIRYTFTGCFITPCQA